MRFALLTCLGLILAIPALAEDAPSPEKVVKAQTVFRLAMTEETLGDMSVRTAQAIVNEINASLAPNGQSLSTDQANALIARFSSAFVAEMKAMEPQVVTVYAKNLSDRELDLMIEMYSNPEMAAIMTKLPRVMEEMMPLIQSSVPRLVQTVVDSMRADGLLSNL
jgi:hypothetical protein